MCFFSINLNELKNIYEILMRQNGQAHPDNYLDTIA